MPWDVLTVDHSGALSRDLQCQPIHHFSRDRREPNLRMTDPQAEDEKLLFPAGGEESTSPRAPEDRAPRSSKPRLFLHIGAGKAGSSAIQHALNENAAALRAQGVIVPDSDLGDGPSIDGQHVRFFSRLDPIDDAKIECVTRKLSLQRLAVQPPPIAVVVSAENLLNRRDLARLFRPSRDLFDIEVIVYIRRQDDFFVAAWNQWHFKTNETFRSWCDRMKGREANWDNLIRLWEETLEGVRYTVRVYDRKRLVRGDVVADFFDTIGVNAHGLVGVGTANASVNRSFNEIAMRVAGRNPSHFQDVHDNRFREFLGLLGGERVYEKVNTGLYLDAVERRELVGLYAESNELLRMRHCPWLPEGGLFSDDYEEPGPIIGEREQIDRELDLLWTVVFTSYCGSRSRWKSVQQNVAPRASNAGRPYPRISRWVRRLSDAGLMVVALRLRRLFRTNQLFDADWYVSQYSDVRESGVDPRKHYWTQGVDEGRDPNPMFETTWYRARNPDVVASGLNPLDHYLFFGAAEGRDPSPRFNTVRYLDQHRDVARAKMNPLLHYLRYGAVEGRSLRHGPAVDRSASLESDGSATSTEVS